MQNTGSDLENLKQTDTAEMYVSQKVRGPHLCPVGYEFEFGGQQSNYISYELVRWGINP